MSMPFPKSITAAIRHLLGATFILAALNTAALNTLASAQAAMRFTCSASAHGAIHLSARTIFAQQVQNTSTQPLPPFGFDLDTLPDHFSPESCSSAEPFFFSLAEPEGNYQVTVVLGGPSTSLTTIRAESRRVFVDQAITPADGSRRSTFNVSVRTPMILTADDIENAAPKQVKLKPREIGALDWDGKLTLEFTGDHPGVRSISIKPIHHVPTIYIAGDSTVVDQTEEPWAAWGQMLPLFFNTKICISNQAESGETIRSFIAERRLEKIMSTMRRGDYLILQFGHNDQKPGRGYVPADTDFKSYLIQYINEARAHGATPILVTPMNRRKFTANGKIIATLGEYPSAMRQVAAQEHVALIDLNAISKTLFESMGESGTLHAFVHYPANTFSHQPEALHDDTHFNAYGAYELARAIVQTIKDEKLPLARYLCDSIPPFDPHRPDSFSAWSLPPSSSFSTETPYSR